jgi:hypothetical protein
MGIHIADCGNNGSMAFLVRSRGIPSIYILLQLSDDCLLYEDHK